MVVIDSLAPTPFTASSIISMFNMLCQMHHSKHYVNLNYLELNT